MASPPASSSTRFLSTPSARRATLKPPPVRFSLVRFLSTPSARRATVADRHLARGRDISIHALREEGDLIQHGQNLAQLVISIHTLREEGDTKSGDTWDLIALFLSTPSARRATVKQSTK